MQNHCGRRKLDRTVGDYACVVPAHAGVIFHDEHVVGEDMSEAEFGFVGRLLLGVLGFFNSDIHGSVSFPVCVDSTRFIYILIISLFCRLVNNIFGFFTNYAIFA